MKILLLTVAGMSTRFSSSLGKSCLKCIYYENNFKESILYNIISKDVYFDKYVIVGGYRFQELKDAVYTELQQYADKILLIENTHFCDWGSGYSLYKGLEFIQQDQFDEIVFAEGDLYVDDISFVDVCDSKKNVVTCNTEPILANKAVAYYYDKDYKLHYIYDTAHETLCVKEEFRGIFNSGQIWKFIEPERVRKIYKQMKSDEWKDTNLRFIQHYFGDMNKEKYEIIQLRDWINCNTIEDYKKILQLKIRKG